MSLRGFGYSYLEYVEEEDEDEDEEENYGQSTPSQSASARGSHFVWQLYEGQRWLSVDNDHVIETHYCQPGAKGMNIYPSHMGVAIAPSAPTVIASPPPSAGYTWEFMGEEGVWIEYQTPSCSLDSAGIERLYQQNPKGQIRFKAGRYSYTLDFSGMCQTNVHIGTKRTVRRTQCEAQQTSSGGMGLQSRWQFQDVDGSWKDFAKRSGTCSVSSQDIEAQYQQNPNGTMNFTTRSFSYQLDFSALTQRNLSTQTTRSVRRLN
uniref:WWE domain-containing protein n=1 Tax=Hucho hucho TaxID=62062 RepID=A0A4W5LGG2_9TELE